MAKKITSIEQLKKLSVDGCDCFIALRGPLRSSKRIHYDEHENRFEIYNGIDASEQILTEERLMDKRYTLIGHAMVNGCLFIG